MNRDQDGTAPDCTVRFDDRSGCGVNVVRNEHGGRTLIAVTFVGRFGRFEPHDLTESQVEQLRAALDAVIRVEPPEDVEGPRYVVAQAGPRVDVAA